MMKKANLSEDKGFIPPDNSELVSRQKDGVETISEMPTQALWKQKLTSRKFWAAVVTFVTTLLVAFGVPDLTIEQVVAVITAGAAMIAYIIGEGMVDKARVEKEEDRSALTPRSGSGGNALEASTTLVSRETSSLLSGGILPLCSDEEKEFSGSEEGEK